MIRPALVFAACLSLFAQPRGTGSISGTVVDAVSGESVRKVVVRLTWHGEPASYATAMTDRSGEFRFTALPSGKYSAWVADEFDQAQPRSPVSDFITLGTGENRRGVKITLPRLTLISGRVIDSDGDPLAGAEVMIMPTGQDRFPWNATADANGAYEFVGLDPGRYLVFVLAGLTADYMPADSTDSPQGALLTTFYGGGSDLKRAIPVELKQGDRRDRIEIRVARAKPVRIRGRIVGVPEAANSAAQPIQNVDLEVRRSFLPMALRGNLRQMVGPGYTFDFQVAPGDYELIASAAVDGKELSAKQAVRAFEGMGEITLSLGPEPAKVNIAGVVRGGGATMACRVSLFPSEIYFDSREIPAVPTDGSEFRLEGVAPGSWDLRVQDLAKGVFVQSVEYAGKPVTGPSINVEAGPDARLVITLNPAGGTVEGEIEDAAAQRRLLDVVLVRADGYAGPAPNLFRTKSDAESRFRFESLPPGHYRIAALETPMPEGSAVPEEERRVAMLGAEIEVRAGSTIEVKPPVVSERQLPEAVR